MSLLPAAHARLYPATCRGPYRQQCGGGFLGVLCGAAGSNSERIGRHAGVRQFERVGPCQVAAKSRTSNPGVSRAKWSGMREAGLAAPQRTIDHAELMGGVCASLNGWPGNQGTRSRSPTSGRGPVAAWNTAGTVGHMAGRKDGHIQRPLSQETKSPQGCEAHREFEPWRALLWRLGCHQLAGVR
jgi:hypothetical protein